MIRYNVSFSGSVQVIATTEQEAIEKMYNEIGDADINENSIEVEECEPELEDFPGVDR